jgi:hypothetical protein
MSETSANSAPWSAPVGLTVAQTPHDQLCQIALGGPLAPPAPHRQRIAPLEHLTKRGDADLGHTVSMEPTKLKG